MHRSLLRRILAAAVVLTLAALPGLTGAGSAHAEAAPTLPAAAQTHRAEFGPAAHHDISRPLRDIPGRAVGNPHKDDGESEEQLPHPPSTSQPDPVVQSASSPAVPATSRSFDGLGVGFTGPQGAFTYAGSPSDDNADVSGTQIVQTVNAELAVFDKTGTTLYGPVAVNTLFAGFGGACETTNDGDPVVRHDRAADRWVITQFANVGSTGGPYYECIAVSRTNDALGAYSRYSYQYASLNDYPKLSVWPDAYYITYNLFTSGAFAGTEACAYDRTAMLAGTGATQQCYTTSRGGLLGADVDGPTAPPAGEPELMTGIGTTNTSLAYWKFHVDWANPANSSFTGPTSLTVATYNPACNGGTCIPQSGTAQQLDSLADRMMFRLAYRNFGDHESYVVTHSVAAGTSTGIRWYELRNNAQGNPTVYQQGSYAPDSAYRWMGSAAMDKTGGIALGFSTSSSATHPGLHYTGRLATDTPGQMTQGEGSLVDGAGSQTTKNRWGDYTSMSIDPSDDCTFWYTGQYVPATGYGNWHTRIGSFQLPGCTTPQPSAGLTNGSFETGSLTGWTAAGSTSVTAAGPHGGTYAAQAGSTSPTNGDSSIAQTFTAPTGTSRLSFWYDVNCPDTVAYDWATATLKDTTSGTTSTILAKTCTNTGTWQQASTAVTAGHSYTLTLTSHDDNYTGDATVTKYDDVILS